MMERFQSKRSLHKIFFCVFDVIYYKGDKVTHLPLLERKELLQSILEISDHIVYTQWMVGNASSYFELVKGLDGIVQKNADSKYQINKRSHDWLKIINYQYTDAYITGFMKDEFRVLLGVEDEGGIKAAGLMKFMVPKARKQFYGMYQDYIQGENGSLSIWIRKLNVA